MKGEILVTLKDESRIDFLLELLRELDFVVEAKILPIGKKTNGKAVAKKKKLTKQQQEFVDEMREAFREMELHQQGKTQLKTLQELLDEL